MAAPPSACLVSVPGIVWIGCNATASCDLGLLAWQRAVAYASHQRLPMRHHTGNNGFAAQTATATKNRIQSSSPDEIEGFGDAYDDSCEM